MRRNWIKLYVDQCLRGTMMKELTAAERWVWFGLLLLAGDSPFEGKVSVTESIGYSDKQLASMLQVSIKTLRNAKQSMIKYEKIVTNNENIVTICNWKTYQSEYKRQKPYRESTSESYNGKLQGKVTNSSLSPSLSSSLSLKDIIKRWNEFAEKNSLTLIRGIPNNSARKRQLCARQKEKDFDFEKLLKKIENQSFLLGENDRGWRADFDWILKPSNYIRIMEEKYKIKERNPFRRE